MAHKVNMLNVQDRRLKLSSQYPNKDSKRELPFQICSLPRAHCHMYASTTNNKNFKKIALLKFLHYVIHKKLALRQVIYKLVPSDLTKYV